jgi:hypothetical protein
MGTMSALRSMSRAANAAVEGGLPKASPEPRPAATDTAAAETKQLKTAKPKEVKKASAPAKTEPSTKGRSGFANDAVITIKSTDHGKGGNGKEVLDCLKDGMTVEKYRAALAKKGRAGYFGWAMKFAIENKLITVK